MKQKIAKWLDEWTLAWMGVVLATKRKGFWIIFLIVFVLFGTLISLMSSVGLGVFKLINLQIVWSAFVGLLGFGKHFSDWLPVFAVAFLQGILIALIGFVWKKRKDENVANTQTASIAAGLALLGTGCPTCGTTLLTPIISSIFSSGGYALAGTLSSFITWGAALIMLLSIKKLGLEVYAIIASERYKLKRGKENE